MQLEIRGGAENLSPAGDRFLGLRRSFEKVKASRPLIRRGDARAGAENGLPQGDPRELRGWIDDPLSVALPGMRER